VGLLGGSIGLAVREKVSNCEIVGYGHRAATIEQAKRMNAIDRAAGTAAEAVKGADLVVLCTPVGLFPALLREIAPALAPGALVTDVGSTKRSIVAAAEQTLSPGVDFVGSHPMAGSEKRGVQYATADLFEQAVCITTPTPRTSPDALGRTEAFWGMLGMEVHRLTPEEHDRRLADASHLPHALAAALVLMQDDASLRLAGKGFLDVTRIAAGDGGLWRDILVDNRDNLRDSIQRLQQRLAEFLNHLNGADADGVKTWLDTAAARRQDLGRAMDSHHREG
jgi:prephenate dehydrogenase